MMRDIKKSIFISIILLLVAGSSIAQHSLDYFLNEAQLHSPTLNEFRKLKATNQLSSRLNHAQNSAFQVSLTSNYMFTPYFNNHGDLVTTSPSPEAVGYDINLFDGGLYSAQLNVERNLFNGKLINALDRRVEIQGEHYEYASELERHNLEKEVTDQYLGAVRTAKLIQLSKEVVNNLEEQLKLTVEMMEKGYVKTQDCLLLRIEAGHETVNLRDVEQQYKSNLLQLYALCGMPDTAIVDISPVTLTPGPPRTTSNFTRRYVLDSLATVSEQSVFEAKYQPQLYVFFNTGLNAVELNNIERRFGMSAGLGLSLPLYDGRQRSLTRQQNLAAQRIIEEYRRFSERNIALQRENNKLQIESLRNTVESLAGEIEDYGHLLEISAKQLQQGNMSMIDYLILLRNFTDLRTNQIEAEIRYQLRVSSYNYWNW